MRNTILLDPLTVTTTEQLALLADVKRLIVIIANNSAAGKLYWSPIANRGQNGFPIFPSTTQTFSPLLGDDPTKPFYLTSDQAGGIDIRISYTIEV